MYSQTMVSNENDTPATRRSTKKADVTCCTRYSYYTVLTNIGMLFILVPVFLFHWRNNYNKNIPVEIFIFHKNREFDHIIYIIFYRPFLLKILTWLAYTCTSRSKIGWWKIYRHNNRFNLHWSKKVKSLKQMTNMKKHSSLTEISPGCGDIIVGKNMNKCTNMNRWTNICINKPELH